ncbi:hypothetical protein [Fimbriimonas ginsengisoli]|uniref:PEGA domain-containing protein n=1 Tax=Fimbriimonas ginsengisoli Gsoil 348 TaxID=661478 RepID=A0A068NN37_FIMGI|nr:hypothetical protein [Fimbriimonas ginsengisoli]AIE84145.1 hypothetical protein OP10G_0777 [Fimbriimonas ginsengisoli Gsoil 348]
MSRLIVTRNSPKDIKMRGLEIQLDGQIVTDLQFEKSYESELPAGEHTLKITNQLYSKKETFELAEGEIVRFQVANVSKGIVGPIMLSAFGIGPYQVSLKRLK